MKVELLYFDGCPSHDALLPRVRELLDQLGDGGEIELRRVESVEDAERERFLGSPTLRIDGVDVDPSASAREDYGIKCRLYATPEGRGPLPAQEWIVTAMNRAAK